MSACFTACRFSVRTTRATTVNDEGAASVPRLSNTDQEGENSSFKTRVPRPSSEDPEGHEHKDMSRSSNDGTYKSPYAQKEIAGAKSRRRVLMFHASHFPLLILGFLEL